ncbi:MULTISPECIES: hypothetical protein [Pseudomonas]
MCLRFKHLESRRFNASLDEMHEAVTLTVQELNWLLDRFDF